MKWWHRKINKNNPENIAENNLLAENEELKRQLKEKEKLINVLVDGFNESLNKSELLKFKHWRTAFDDMDRWIRHCLELRQEALVSLARGVDLSHEEKLELYYINQYLAGKSSKPAPEPPAAKSSRDIARQLNIEHYHLAKTIKRNMEIFKAIGPLPYISENKEGRGAPVKHYLLNYHQYLLLLALMDGHDLEELTYQRLIHFGNIPYPPTF